MLDSFDTNPISRDILCTDESLFTYDDIVEQEVIAHGGMCVTIKCVLSTKDGGSVIAIKRPRENQDVSDIRRRLIRREAIIANHVGRHTNSIGVIDWGRGEGSWIAMEYADGGTLADRIDDIPFIESIWMAIHITRGLRYAHRNGIYHFDLKPENIAFKSYGGLWDTPKIIDWGAAQATKGGPFPYVTVKGKSKVNPTHEKESGKPIELPPPLEHLSPEIISPGEKRDNTTDIYLLSSTFYRLLTGRHKYPPTTLEKSGEKVFKKRHIIDEDKTPKQPSTIADIPASIDGILLKGLERYKEDRYQDIYRFERDLVRVYNEEKESKHPPVY
jgi:serine/threonine protein kinase